MRTLSCGMHVGSCSLTRDPTQTSCIGSTESYPLDHQGSPTSLHFYRSFLSYRFKCCNDHFYIYDFFPLRVHIKVINNWINVSKSGKKVKNDLFNSHIKSKIVYIHIKIYIHIYTCFIKYLWKDKVIVVDIRSWWDTWYIRSEKNNFTLYIFLYYLTF